MNEKSFSFVSSEKCVLLFYYYIILANRSQHTHNHTHMCSFNVFFWFFEIVCFVPLFYSITIIYFSNRSQRTHAHIVLFIIPIRNTHNKYVPPFISILFHHHHIGKPLTTQTHTHITLFLNTISSQHRVFIISIHNTITHTRRNLFSTPLHPKHIIIGILI